MSLNLTLMAKGMAVRTLFRTHIFPRRMTALIYTFPRGTLSAELSGAYSATYGPGRAKAWR